MCVSKKLKVKDAERFCADNGSTLFNLHHYSCTALIEIEKFMITKNRGKSNWFWVKQKNDKIYKCKNAKSCENRYGYTFCKEEEKPKKYYTVCAAPNTFDDFYNYHNSDLCQDRLR